MTLSAALTSTSSRLLYSLRLRCATNVQAATHQACGRSLAVFISKIIMKGEGEEGLCIFIDYTEGMWLLRLHALTLHQQCNSRGVLGRQHLQCICERHCKLTQAKCIGSS